MTRNMVARKRKVDDSPRAKYDEGLATYSAIHCGIGVRGVWAHGRNRSERRVVI
jgi:hypothetical protein